MVDSKNLNDRKRTFKFPNVATEILSILNTRTMPFYGITQKQPPFTKIEKFIAFFQNHEENPEDIVINPTRAGYVCKILSSLILEKNCVLTRRVLFDKPLFRDILKCSQNKSISGLLYSILTLLAPFQQTPVMLGMPAVQDTTKDQRTTTQYELMKETYDLRLSLFEEVIEMTISTANNPKLCDLHSNLASLIMMILTRDFIEQEAFVGIIFKYIDTLKESFSSTFFSSYNNKVGNLFLILLERTLKTLEAAKLASWLKQIDSVNILQTCLTLLEGYFNPEVNRHVCAKVTPSFASEGPRLNPKVYKAMEAVNVMMKSAMLEKKPLDVLKTSAFQKYIFQFFEEYPFNNILHNQLKKFLMMVLEYGDSELINLYFSKNQAFMQFLNRLTEQPAVVAIQRPKFKVGYIGHIITLCSVLKNKSNEIVECLNESETWNNFQNTLYAQEKGRETKVLGDIDFQSDVTNGSEFSFDFTIDEIRAKYSVFLNLKSFSENASEEHTFSSEDLAQRRMSVEMTPEEQAQKDINTNLGHELQEAENSSIESNYQDYNYWKPQVDFNVEELLEQINS